MNVTQHDLSYNLAHLDYQALVTTAVIAVGHCTEEASQYITKIRRSITDSTSLKLNAEWLVSETKQLQIACETLSTLMGGFDRGRIKIVNKPKVKR